METLYLYLQINPALKAGLFFVVGTCLGSFATALMYRLPRKLDWVRDRSRCTSCNHVLGVRDLVPVLSWLLSKGKCRHCGASVSMRYPVTEIAAGLLAAALSFLI